MNVKISNGNTKIGAIPSVSLPSGVTCRSDCECRCQIVWWQLYRMCNYRWRVLDGKAWRTSGFQRTLTKEAFL